MARGVQAPFRLHPRACSSAAASSASAQPLLLRLEPRPQHAPGAHAPVRRPCCRARRRSGRRAARRPAASRKSTKLGSTRLPTASTPRPCPCGKAKLGYRCESSSQRRQTPNAPSRTFVSWSRTTAAVAQLRKPRLDVVGDRLVGVAAVDMEEVDRPVGETARSPRRTSAVGAGSRRSRRADRGRRGARRGRPARRRRVLVALPRVDCVAARRQVERCTAWQNAQ